MYTGIGASAGIGIGSAVIVKEPSLAYDNKAVSDVDAEKQRFWKDMSFFLWTRR